jgi:exopolysaccharide biosynthesis protein
MATHHHSFECSFRRRGLTLEELADMLIEQGAMYAINMDGGGSSTLVFGMDHQVINSPSCLDIPKITCERAVASVLCVSASSVTTSSR